MANTCHLKEPSVPFATVTGVTLTLDDGTTSLDPANPSVGLVKVDGKLLSKSEFDSLYAVESPEGPVAATTSPFPG